MSNLRLEACLPSKSVSADSINEKAERTRRQACAKRAVGAPCHAGVHGLHGRGAMRRRAFYEVIIQYVDIADPKFARLRARLVISVKLDRRCEYRASWRLSDKERERRLTRAREILALLVDGGAP